VLSTTLVLPCGFILSGYAYHGSDLWVAECKGLIGLSPQTLIERPKAFPMQLLSRLGGEFTIANDVDYALYARIIHFK
jgi:hypothetical protein